jgi:hypothetical protein
MLAMQTFSCNLCENYQSESNWISESSDRLIQIETSWLCKLSIHGASEMVIGEFSPISYLYFLLAIITL